MVKYFQNKHHRELQPSRMWERVLIVNSGCFQNFKLKMFPKFQTQGCFQNFKLRMFPKFQTQDASKTSNSGCFQNFKLRMFPKFQTQNVSQNLKLRIFQNFKVRMFPQFQTKFFQNRNVFKFVIQPRWIFRECFQNCYITFCSYSKTCPVSSMYHSVLTWYFLSVFS